LRPRAGIAGRAVLSRNALANSLQGHAIPTPIGEIRCKVVLTATGFSGIGNVRRVMVRAFWRFVLTTALAGTLVGCSHTMAQRKPPPPDPLLVTRKPIEGKPRPIDADLTSRLQPPTLPGAGDSGVTPMIAAPPVQAARLRPPE
jgi:hypothetical protein